MTAPALPQLQAIPDLNPGYLNATSQVHTNLGTDFNAPRLPPGYQLFAYQLGASTLPTINVVPSLSSGPIQDAANFVYDEHQPPVVLHRAPDRTSSGRRRYQRASAINIEGLWIDKDDLYTGARQGGGMISIHECQWAISSNPCGMWIVGSKSHISAHIRKWHDQGHTNRTARCLWDGCTTTKAMLRDSLNRHILTVHIGEGFHCHECNQTFSRKNVYDSHLEIGEACRDSGIAIVYGTERRVIDTRRALERAGDVVRYAGH